MGCQVAEDDQRRRGDQRQERPRLGIAEEAARLPFHPEPVVAREVDPGEQHEDDHNVLHHRTVKAGDARRARGKPAGAKRREGVTGGVERPHPGKSQSHIEQDGKGHVDAPQRGGGLSEPWFQLVGAGAGEFRPVQVHPSGAQQR